MPPILMSIMGIMVIIILAIILCVVAIKAGNFITESFKSLSPEERRAISEIKELVKMRSEINNAITEKYESLTDFGKKKIQSIL